MLDIGVLTGQSASLAGAALGAVLSAYGAVGLASPRFTVSPNAERWLSPLIGILTGFVTGAKEELIQALGLSFTVSTVALAVALGLSGQLQFATAAGSLLAVIPALVGMLIGQRVCSRLQADVFRKWFFVGLIVLGVYMMLRVLLP